MNNDVILEIGINAKKQLYVKPASATFPYMYREAVDVYWDETHLYLHSPVPRAWSYAQWFRHIIAAAQMQSYDLIITQETEWINIPEQLQSEILHARDIP